MLRLKSIAARAAAGLALTPLALSLGAITLAVATGLNDDASFGRPEAGPCRATANDAPLRDLEPGLIETDIGHGPFLLALTPHSVMAAPYHRLSAGIVAAHRALAEPPGAGRRGPGLAGASQREPGVRGLSRDPALRRRRRPGRPANPRSSPCGATALSYMSQDAQGAASTCNLGVG